MRSVGTSPNKCIGSSWNVVSAALSSSLCVGDFIVGDARWPLRSLNSRTPWIVHFRRGVVGCITVTSVLETRQDLKERGTRKTHCLGLRSLPPFLPCRRTLPIFTEAP